MLAVLVFIVPKIGGAADLAIKIPTPDTQKWYLRSVNHTVDVFDSELNKLAANEPFALADIDLDTGQRVKREDYPRTDKTYAGLLERLTSKPGRTIPEDLKRDILGYYEASGGVGLRERVQQQLNLLKGMTASDGSR